MAAATPIIDGWRKRYRRDLPAATIAQPLPNPIQKLSAGQTRLWSVSTAYDSGLDACGPSPLSLLAIQRPRRCLVAARQLDHWALEDSDNSDVRCTTNAAR
jgi:hypothetical protein